MGSSSGLIIAFVVALWAAYFVPLVLRRYDEASKNTSVESSGRQSRVIARPVAAEVAEPAPIIEPVEMPERPVVQVAPVRTTGAAARLAARRRRRTLLTLLTVTAIVAVLAGLKVVAPLWVVAPVALVAAWLVACRIQVRGELGIARPRALSFHLPEMMKSSTVSAVVDEEDTVIVSGQFEDINPGRKHTMEDVPLEANALDDQIVIAVPSVSTTGEALWDPLPVTLPTYVTKPRAGRTVRTIEFGQAGAWTSGHIEGEDTELPQSAQGADEHRRAVGD